MKVSADCPLARDSSSRFLLTPSHLVSQLTCRPSFNDTLWLLECAEVFTLLVTFTHLLLSYLQKPTTLSTSSVADCDVVLSIQVVEILILP